LVLRGKKDFPVRKTLLPEQHAILISDGETEATEFAEEADFF